MYRGYVRYVTDHPPHDHLSTDRAIAGSVRAGRRKIPTPRAEATQSCVVYRNATPPGAPCALVRARKWSAA